MISSKTNKIKKSALEILNSLLKLEVSNLLLGTKNLFFQIILSTEFLFAMCVCNPFPAILSSTSYISPFYFVLPFPSPLTPKL